MRQIKPNQRALHAALLVGAALAGASGCDSATGGRVVDFQLQIAAPGAASQFETRTGWRVTLDEACVALGPVYLFENGPPVARRRPLERIHDWLVPNALAHVGDNHFYGGAVKGEWVEQVAFDALGGAPALFGDLPGVHGAVRSASILLDPPRSAIGGDKDCLHGHHAYVSGEATSMRTGEVVPFEGGLDIGNEGDKRRIQGISTSGTLDDGVQVSVDLRLQSWLDNVDFAALTVAESGAERRRIEPGSQAHAAWEAGIRAFQGVAVHLRPGDEEVR